MLHSLRVGTKHGVDCSEVLAVGDGAEGIWGMFEFGVPKGKHMLDGFHSKKKVSSRCQEEFGKKEGWELGLKVNEQLDLGSVDEAIRTLLTIWSENPVREGNEEDSIPVSKLVAYLRRHQEKLEQGAKARKEGATEETGLQEKANDIVCAARCKHGEMHWSRDGLDHILQHRCAILNEAYHALAA